MDMTYKKLWWQVLISFHFADLDSHATWQPLFISIICSSGSSSQFQLPPIKISSVQYWSMTPAVLGRISPRCWCDKLSCYCPSSVQPPLLSTAQYSICLPLPAFRYRLRSQDLLDLSARICSQVDGNYIWVFTGLSPGIGIVWSRKQF